MKKLSILVMTLFAVSMIQAQTNFKEGDKVVNVGVGFGTYVTYGKTTFLPLSISYEQGILDELFDEKSSLSVGGYLGYYSTKYIDPTTYNGKEAGWKYSNITLGARAAVHYDLIDELDTYGGLMLGYRNHNYSYYGYNANFETNVPSSLGFSVFIGARYYFTEKIAAFAELGYGVSAIELGVAIKL